MRSFHHRKPPLESAQRQVPGLTRGLQDEAIREAERGFGAKQFQRRYHYLPMLDKRFLFFNSISTDAAKPAGLKRYTVFNTQIVSATAKVDAQAPLAMNASAKTV